MLVRFWGTRGSLPVGTRGSVIRGKIKQALLKANGRRFDDEAAIEHFIEEELDFPTRSGYGGDSACVEITDGDQRIICDFGTGVRALGNQIMKEMETSGPCRLYFVLSHLHWDHIMGLPFFIPAHTTGNEIIIHGGHPGMEKVFRRQQSAPCFPVHWDEMAADITLKRLESDQTYEINGFQVTPHLQKHPDGSYGYRFERNGKAVVYSTDCEHKLESDDEIKEAIEFYQDADLVIFDSMYSLADMISIKEDWGHSSNIIGVDLCRQANVKHYCMFHHEPVYSDQTIYTVLQETIRYEELMREGAPMKVSSAYDGMEIVV